MYRFSQLGYTMKWPPLPQGLTRILLSNKGILENAKRSAPKPFEAIKGMAWIISDYRCTLGRYSSMTAKLFMNPNPVVLRTNDTIAHGARQIMAKQRRSLPVVDDEGRFKGMLTVNCLLYLCLPHAATTERGLTSVSFVQSSLDDLRKRLKENMEKPVTICLKKKENVAVLHPDTPILETLLTLYNAKANLPVVEKDSGRLVGMISYYNVGDKIMEEGFEAEPER